MTRPDPEPATDRFSNVPIRSPLPMTWLQFNGPLWPNEVVVKENFARGNRASWEKSWRGWEERYMMGIVQE